MIFESKNIEVHKYSIRNPGLDIFRIIPRTLKSYSSILVVPHPLPGCKPYILLAVLLAKRGLTINLLCSNFYCIKPKFEKIVIHAMREISCDFIIFHNITPEITIQKPIILLESTDEDLTRICEDNISENCVDPGQCLRSLTTKNIADSNLNIVCKVEINLLNLDSILNACDVIVNTVRQHLYGRCRKLS